MTDLLGVWFDGSPLGVGVPANPRTQLSVPRGVDLDVFVDVIDSAGASLDVVGSTSAMYVRPDFLSDDNVISKVSGVPVAGARGRLVFSILGSATRDVAPGIYVYEVWLDLSGVRRAVVPVSAFVLVPSLHRGGAL